MPKGKYIRTKPSHPNKRQIIFLPKYPAIALVELTKDQFAVIDVSDAESVGAFNWYAHWNSCTRSFYAAKADMVAGQKQRTIKLHEFLLGALEGHSVYHIAPGNTLDYRRSNLRHATPTMQILNQRIRRDNKSGHKNICLVRGKWKVSGRRDKQTKFIGYFDLIEDAIEAAKVFQ